MYDPFMKTAEYQCLIFKVTVMKTFIMLFIAINYYYFAFQQSCAGSRDPNLHICSMIGIYNIDATIFEVSRHNKR